MKIASIVGARPNFIKCAPLSKELRKEFDEVKIFVKTVGPFHFVRESLPQKNVEVIQTKKDVGVVFNEFSEDDREDLFSYFE